ncbi:uncharacterized protein LOC131215559 [Anopheles bellator]|uniref:uncharacterized protein LOC131215559 n=1 Tax=Anopheles bellator TaxID=139047 RepID=UPI00264A0BB6|nr:uncharacterized protein LOC131215559 [Anopheles bellator]
MAAYRPKKIELQTTQRASDLQEKNSKVSESLVTQQRPATQNDAKQTKPNPDCGDGSGEHSKEREKNRPAIERNPAILGALDSIHRSLLFNNLKFDTGKTQNASHVERSSQDSDQVDATVKKSNHDDVRAPTLETENTRMHQTVASSAVQQAEKVNIVHAKIDARPTNEPEEVCHHPGSVLTSEYQNLQRCSGQDWNNNASSNGAIGRVKTMVKRHEQGRMVGTSAHDAHCGAVKDEGRLCSDTRGCEVETSDFDSASVTSDSSAADIGGRSQRTSSAFSEGSRDVASIDRFDMAMVQTSGATDGAATQVDAARHATTITININCRCDTNPQRMSKAAVEAKSKANVDTARCAGETSEPTNLGRTEFGSKPCSSHRPPHRADDGKQASNEHSIPQTDGSDDTESEELMELEQQEDEGSAATGDYELEDELDQPGKASHDDVGHGAKKKQHKAHRGSLDAFCRSPEDDEYHDCDELHESTLSFYEEATSQPATPPEGKSRSPDDGDKPMISIVQELTEDRGEVMSTITLNKAQIKEMQKFNNTKKIEGRRSEPQMKKKPSEEQPERRRKSHGSDSCKKRHDKVNFNRQQRIIDDNFCNEILDSTIHFDRLYGIKRPQQGKPVAEGSLSPAESVASPAREECFSDSALCGVASPGEESFDSSMSLGKLESKPRYSGKTVGRLMVARLKKLQQVSLKPTRTGTSHPPAMDSSDASTNSSMLLLHTSGPKKPPRTFANSPKRSVVRGKHEASAVKPSCPTREELDVSDPSNRGKDSRPKSHHIGWRMAAENDKIQSIPAQVYDMLHYSEDETRKRLIRTGNSRAAPQQSSSGGSKRRQDELLGPKLDIDTVDGRKPEPRTPDRRHSSSTDFDRFVRESNVKSTPHRREGHSDRGKPVSATTRRILEEFLNDERCAANHGQLPINVGERRRRTTGSLFERRRQQQENFLDDARRTNHEPRRKSRKGARPPATALDSVDCPAMQRAASRSSITSVPKAATANGKIVKRKTFRKAALLKHTRSLFEASKKKIWSVKKCETPKKVNTGCGDPDPNINRNSSAKKKQNLHHKHLGYTPDNLRCKSCCRASDLGTNEECREAVVSLKRVSDQQSVPRAKGNKENRSPPDPVDEEERSGRVQPNRKSVRSLNFATQCQQSQQVRTPLSGESRDEAPSPSKTSKQLSEPAKFMKSLRSLKISPRKYFRFGSQTQNSNDLQGPTSKREATDHALGEFHSFDDLNLDSVAHMGDFLNQIRQIVERQGGPNERVHCNQVVHSSVDAHDYAGEPIYQEITQKGHKTILNEFISSESNKRYVMVNNDPNILYATVNKPVKSGPGLTTRARSLTDVTSTGVVDPVVTLTPVSKPLNNTSKSQGKPTNRPAVTLSPMGVDHYADDEDESYLYKTALTGSPGCAGGRRSLTTTSTTRRSLFSPESSFCSSSDDSEGRQASDDNDISVLQEEDQQQEAALEEVQESFIMQEKAGDRQVARRENERIQHKPNDDEGVDECGTGLESWRRAFGQAGREEQQQALALVAAQESLIVRERAEDRQAVYRANERIAHRPNDDEGVDECGTGLESWRRGFAQAASRDCFAFEKDIIVDLEPVGNTATHRSVVGDVVPGNSKELGAWKHKGNVAPIGCFDSDGEIESLDRYQDKEVVELVNSLHNNVTLSDIGTLETGSSVAPDSEGYDTVDFVLPACRRQFVPQVESSLGDIPNNDPRDVTVDTVDASKLISHPSNDNMRCTSTVSPLTGSPSSGKTSSSSSTGGAVMRNLKQKLRSSFRKSKSFIKTERQRIANYIREERSGSSKNSASSSLSSSSSPTRQQRRQEEETDEMYHSLADSERTSMVAGSMMELSNQFLGELITQIKQQGDARKQLKQALAICRTTHEFECSTELIEAERLLLLATLKETAARNELSKIDYATNGMTVPDRKRVGKVALNHFEFPLKDTAIGDTLFNYFYIVVCTYKHEVRATLAQERRTDGRVYFRDCEIVFRDLDADYEIRVEVFVLRLRKNVKNISFENRYHLDKESKRTATCPSPSKFRRAGKMLSFRTSSPKNFDFDNEFSRFKSQGFLTLTSFTLVSSNVGEGDERAGSPLGRTIDGTYLTALNNNSSTATALLDDDSPTSPYYSVSSNFQKMMRRQGNQNVFLVEDFKYLALDSMAYTSNMSGTIGMSVNSEVRFEGSDVHGFLDVGEKVDDSINWNRRWCKINRFTLEFWNYPQESNEKQPIQCIDLVRCVNDRIELADRSICSRARTMKVDIFAAHSAAGAAASCNSSGIGSYRSTGGTNPSTGTGVASSIDQGRSNVTCYLLAVDSHSELRRWMNELNRVAKFLKEWKI